MYNLQGKKKKNSDLGLIVIIKQEIPTKKKKLTWYCHRKLGVVQMLHSKLEDGFLADFCRSNKDCHGTLFSFGFG